MVFVFCFGGGGARHGFICKMKFLCFVWVFFHCKGALVYFESEFGDCDQCLEFCLGWFCVRFFPKWGNRIGLAIAISKQPGRDFVFVFVLGGKNVLTQCVV